MEPDSPADIRSRFGQQVRARFLGIAFLILCSLVDCFAASSFIGLGSNTWSGGVSGNGKVVVGWTETPGKHQAFRWSAKEGLVFLGTLPGETRAPHALAVSGDGTIVVGTIFVSERRRAFRWTMDHGMTDLGPQSTQAVSHANAISQDGSTIVGTASWTGGYDQLVPFRWSKTEGMVPLELSGKKGYKATGPAAAVSSDGSVIVGYADFPSGLEAFRWKKNSGLVSLGNLPHGNRSCAFAVSGDGDVVAGHYCKEGAGIEAFRWTPKTGMVRLDLSSAMAISMDGSLILGKSHSDSDTAGALVAGLHGNWHAEFRSKSGEEAFIWDAVNGMRRLHPILTKEYNLDLSEWTLSWANGISADGKTIVGQGIHKDHIEAWVAFLDSPLQALTNAPKP